jgi:hypothetical protein
MMRTPTRKKEGEEGRGSMKVTKTRRGYLVQCTPDALRIHLASIPAPNRLLLALYNLPGMARAGEYVIRATSNGISAETHLSTFLGKEA